MSFSKRVSSFLMCLTIWGGVATADVLVYDENTNNQYAQQAAANLPYAVTLAGAADFNAQLTSHNWDVVLVDCPSYIPEGGWSDLIDFVNGGGRVVMSFWDWDNDVGFGDPGLFTAFGFDTAASISLVNGTSTLVAASTAAASSVFADVPGMPHSTWFNTWFDDGDAFTFTGGEAIAQLAGVTDPVTIVNGGGNAIATLLLDEWSGEGAVELWEGMADYLLTDSSGILVYDENTYNHYAEQAANGLSPNVTVAGAVNFNALLTGRSWDLVLVDCPSTVPPDGWGDLIDFIDGGGLVVMSFWDWDDDLGYGDPGLFGAFGFTTATSISLLNGVDTLVPAATDAGDRVFTGVSGIPHSSWSNSWSDDGDAFTFSGGQAIAQLVGVSGPVTIVNSRGNAIATFLVDEWSGEGAVDFWKGMARLLPYDNLIFSDGFESGDTSSWSVTVQ